MALTERQIGGLVAVVAVGVTFTVISQVVTTQAVKALELEEPSPLVGGVATLAALAALGLIANSSLPESPS